MNYFIAFVIVVVGQVAMELVYPVSSVSRLDVVFGAFFGLLMLASVKRLRGKP